MSSVCVYDASQHRASACSSNEDFPNRGACHSSKHVGRISRPLPPQHRWPNAGNASATRPNGRWRWPHQAYATPPLFLDYLHFDDFVKRDNHKSVEFFDEIVEMEIV